MGQYADIINAWKGRLEPVPPGNISGEAPPAAWQLLTTAGLPTAEAYALDFVRDQRMAKPFDHLGRGYLFVAEDLSGFRYGLSLADGHIDRIFHGYPEPPNFVNSTLSHFLILLGECSLDLWPYLSVWRPATDQHAALERFEELVRRRDPAALAPDAYWRFVIANFRQQVEP
ncbi:SUKH-4 family immunity protein [Actinoplanes sp. NPDC049265]|uniref:SUKH-4 family immunity protein n=1 Tax=Actinoplanes sp. NPDC049265 TaxID=3363902 RepID=UPI00371D37E3